MATLGEAVFYRLSIVDVATIDERYPLVYGSPVSRNPVHSGEIRPATVVRINDDTVNLQVHLDGNCLHWATSVRFGSEPGQWAWR